METRTPGSASGPQKRTDGNTGTALRADSTTPVRSCGSPTSTATGSPPSPPARNTGSSLTWNYATGAGPDARTGSAAPRTPGCATCPCTASTQNQMWCEIVALACDLLAWMQMLALTGAARRWEPKRLRLRLFTCAGRIVRGSRRLQAPPRRQLALDRGDHHRDYPSAGPRTQLTSQNPSLQPGRTDPRARGTPPTRRDSRATTLTSRRKRRRAATSSHRTKITKDAG